MTAEAFLRIPKAPTNHPKFGLRMLFVAMAVLAVVLWAAGAYYRHARQQRVVLDSAHRLATPSLITDADLKTIHEYLRVGQYKSLDFTNSQVTDEGVKLIVDLPSLEKIVLDGSAITDSSLTSLASLPRLKFVQVLDTRITWKAAAQFSAKHPETYVVLNPGSVHSSISNGMVSIFLSAPVTNPSVLSGLNEATAIKGFSAQGCGWFGDKHLAHLRGLTSIERMDLHGTAITDKSIDTILEMKRLVQLSYPNTISADGTQRLKAGLPKCHQLRLN